MPLVASPRLLILKLALAVLTGVLIAVVAHAVAPVPTVVFVREDAALGDRTLLDPILPDVEDGSTVTLTDTLQSYSETVRVDAGDTGRSIDKTPLSCHGGRARIVWHVGNLEPTQPATGILLTARFDGSPIGSILRGSSAGNYNDTPVSIQAVVDCPVGDHVVDLMLTKVEGAWGIPYVQNVGDPVAQDFSMNRGFVIEEIH